METDPSLWLHYSFFRRPEWRWLRAEFLNATGRRFNRRIDDDWVAKARDAQRGRGGRKADAIRAAHGIWSGESTVKWELEARLLTEEPLDQIAVRCRLPLPTTEAYTEVFFGVRSMRKATDWLLARAVGYRLLTGCIPPLLGAAWKFAALTGGELILDVVIAATLGRALPERILKGMGRRREIEELRLRLAARLWVASMAAVTDEEFSRVVKARGQLRELDALLGRVRTVSPWELAMEEFLMRLPAMVRKARKTDGYRVETGCCSSSSTPRQSNTEPTAGPMLLDLQQVVNDVANAVDAVQKADNSVRTPSTGGHVTGPKQRRRAA